jgi:6-phosphogluconolactonase
MPESTTSRRALMSAATTLGIIRSAQATPPRLPVRGGAVFGYIGSYTGASSPPGNGQGITRVRLDTATGELTRMKLFPAPSPSWLAVGPAQKTLYAINEIASYGPDRTGSVTAFAIDRATGDLSPLNTVSSHGKGPAHGSVHPSGRFVFVANYGSGTVAVLPLEGDGSLGEAVDVHQDDGPHGAARPEAGPPGNFSISDHDGPHAHMIASDPTGRFVIVNDLGLDRSFVWKFDAASGKLTANDPPFIAAASAGAGPRHFAFHPNGRIFYNLYEEASQLAVYDWDAPTAAATLKQTVTTVPGYAGTNFASEIVVSADARFLYVGNRLHNTVGIFAIAADGRVRWVGEEWTRGDYPRHLALDPTGDFMLVCNHRSDQVTVFRVDRGSGRLHFTERYFAVGSPAMALFVG